MMNLQHSLQHLNCPACNSRSLLHAEVHLADLDFHSAFHLWLSARTLSSPEEHDVRYLSDESVRTYKEYAWALGVFFGGMKLNQIHDGHLRTYQSDRATCAGGWKKKAGQNRIQKEVALLLRLLRAANLWEKDLNQAFQQLPFQDTDAQRVLDPYQQEQFLKVLRSRAEWFWLYDYSVIALQTTASTKEIRCLRLKDLDFRNRTIRVGPESSKNKFRNRTIPLETPEAISALVDLRRRAEGFGSQFEFHYLFPFGAGSRRGDLDPLAPMSKWGLKGPWEQARTIAGVPWLRPYDLRHTGITRMAEGGIPIPTIMGFAGHMSTRMQQHYTTICMQAKRTAAASVWTRPAVLKKPSGVVTFVEKQRVSA
jgi:integrase